MTLEEYVLTYRGTDGNIVVNIPDYYDRFVHPLGAKYAERSLKHNNLVICPLHDDNDPSFGLIRHRFLDGVMIYHCFGCNASGTVIRLHQRIQSMYFGRSLTEEAACRELAALYGVPLGDFESLSQEDYEKRFQLRYNDIGRLMHRYTVKEFKDSLLNARKNASGGVVSLEEINSASVKMIATVKGMYTI